jgi:hypothetical protein
VIEASIGQRVRARFTRAHISLSLLEDVVRDQGGLMECGDFEDLMVGRVLEVSASASVLGLLEFGSVSNASSVV